MLRLELVARITEFPSVVWEINRTLCSLCLLRSRSVRYLGLYFVFVVLVRLTAPSTSTSCSPAFKLRLRPCVSANSSLHDVLVVRAIEGKSPRSMVCVTCSRCPCLCGVPDSSEDLEDCQSAGRRCLGNHASRLVGLPLASTLASSSTN